MNKFTLTNVHSPFDRHNSSTYGLGYSGETIEAIYNKQVKNGAYVHASINGIVIPREQWCHVKPRVGDHLVFIPEVQGGDDGKMVLSIISFIVLAYFAPSVASSLLPGAAADSFAMFAMTAGVMVAGGMAVTSLIGPTQPKASNDNWETSQTYGWSPVTRQQQGIPVPKFYGKNKLYGNIIAGYTKPDPSDMTKQYLNMIVSLGDGPIKGITKSNGVDYDVVINDQPAHYYDNVTLDVKNGTTDQTCINLAGEDVYPRPEYAPNRKVVHASPVTYLLPDSDYTDVDIDISFPRGLYNASGGDIINHAVGIKIEIREQDGSWSTLVATSVTGNAVQSLSTSYTASETYSGGSPVTINRGTKYEIRVTKTSEDKGSQYGDEVRLNRVREHLSTPFAYPMTALLGINALATDQLSGSLNISCVVEGAIVSVYDGVEWNLEYSTNPAWVLYDLLSAPIITGSEGSYTVSGYRGMTQLNLNTFLQLAQFCDELVPDGMGGYEKRITFNGGFDTETTRWEAVLKVCEIARCAPIWNGSTLSIAIDRAATPKQLFVVSNIFRDSFKETFLPRAERASEVEVQYRDANQDYERVPFTIFDSEIGDGTYRIKQELFGITKQSEAYRAGMYQLRKNKYLKRTIEFDAGIDALHSTVGDVVNVQHDTPQWGQGGRIITGSETVVRLDFPISIPEDETWDIMVRSYDPVTEGEVLMQRTISNVSEDGYYVYTTTAFSTVPSAEDIVTVGKQNLNCKPFRILSIRKKDDQNVTIEAIEYDERVYDCDSTTLIPDDSYTPPQSTGSGAVLKPITPEEINDRFAHIEVPSYTPDPLDFPQTSGAVFSSNSPNPGYVNWNSFKLIMGGTEYTIANNSVGTANKYIYWIQGNSTLSTTDSAATLLGSGGWILCYNNGGTAEVVFAQRLLHAGMLQANTITASHLAVGEIISDSAQIKSGILTDAHIANLSADKITTGTMSFDRLSGGTLDASEINAGTINASRVNASTLSGAYASSHAAGPPIVDEVAATNYTDWDDIEDSSHKAPTGATRLRGGINIKTTYGSGTGYIKCTVKKNGSYIWNGVQISAGSTSVSKTLDLAVAANDIIYIYAESKSSSSSTYYKAKVSFSFYASSQDSVTK